MGEVYVAYDQELEREIAVKTLPLTQSDSEQLKERFQLQARAAARIGHPGIVETYDRGIEGNLPFVVMERLRGHNLQDRIRERRPLDLGFILRVGIELTRAVHAAHKKGVIHRDLKPSNVFLAEVGDQFDVVKVLDFGVAKVTNAKALTRTGQIIGTISYMAPEQLESSKHVDARADVFSIGCILYEMLTGVPPFSAESDIELILKVKNDSPEPVIFRRGDAPKALIELVVRAMSKDRFQRFANAAQLADALCGIASTTGVSIPPQYESLKPPPPVDPSTQADEFATAPTVLHTQTSMGYATKDTVHIENIDNTKQKITKAKRRLYTFIILIVLAFTVGAIALKIAFGSLVN